VVAWAVRCGSVPQFRKEGCGVADEFKPGDVVTLKSGGPKITVEHVVTDHDLPTVAATWFAGGNQEAKKGRFAAAAVRLQRYADHATAVQYKPGDVVVLKSDGPPMTVNRVSNTGSGPPVLDAVWFVGEAARCEQFVAAAVKLAEPRPGRPA
jgi:uncharacterized protein YodC (DUF2158 family)